MAKAEPGGALDAAAVHRTLVRVRGHLLDAKRSAQYGETVDHLTAALRDLGELLGSTKRAAAREVEVLTLRVALQPGAESGATATVCSGLNLDLGQSPQVLDWRWEVGGGRTAGADGTEPPERRGR